MTVFFEKIARSAKIFEDFTCYMRKSLIEIVGVIAITFPNFSGKTVVLASMRSILILVAKNRHSGVDNVHNSL